MGQGNTKSGIIGWGSNENSQLASSSSNKSKSVRIIETTRGMNAIAVSASANYSAILLDSGEVLTFGKGDSGQLGLGMGEYQSSVPRPVRGQLHGRVVKSISCGDYHCAAVTDSHSLFTWGRGQHGRLGHGLIEDEPAPRLVEAFVGIPVLAVSCGEYHTLVSTVSNGVYSFGLGLSGRLGLGSEEDQLVPTLIPGPVSARPVIGLAAGGHHSAVLVQPGVLYTWGGSNFGKLGHGDQAPCLTPKLVTHLSHVRLASVALGQHHSAAVSVNGEVFVWGKSQGSRCEDLLLPDRVEEFAAFPAASIGCGKSTVFALTHTGDVYVRGPISPEIQLTSAGFAPASEATGQTNRQQSYCMQGKGVVELAAGDQHCVAMVDPARVLTVGHPEDTKDDELVVVTPTATVSCAPPSLIHVLESVIRAVPPPPVKPSLEGEMAFLSGELKFAQIQNQKLARRLEEALARISHLERENVSLREELDSSMQCLPVDRIVHIPVSECNEPMLTPSRVSTHDTILAD